MGERGGLWSPGPVLPLSRPFFSMNRLCFSPRCPRPRAQSAGGKVFTVLDKSPGSTVTGTRAYKPQWESSPCPLLLARTWVKSRSFLLAKTKLLMVLASSGGCREEMSECPGALSTITVQTRRTTTLQMNADLGFQIPAASLLPSLFVSGRLTSSH